MGWQAVRGQRRILGPSGGHPWTFANIWEVLIMKRMLVHECFAEVFQKMFNGVHSVLGAGPCDFEFINLLFDAVWQTGFQCPIMYPPYEGKNESGLRT